jgi:hypothetical protein
LKKSVLFTTGLSLIGALLLALCFVNNWASMLCFIALVPMLIVVKKSSFLHSAIFTLINSALVVLIIRITSVEMSIEASIGQFLIFALPWIFYQHIRINHNEKLGYLALVSGWIFLEWVAAQYFGSWTGLQLGHSLTGVPFLVKWYGFLGVSAGSVWILAINIQLSRIILPAQSFTRKHATINGILVMMLPVLSSFFWPDAEKSGNISATTLDVNGKILLLSENDKSLSANELKFDHRIYNSVFDTVKNASIGDKEGKEIAVMSKKLRVGHIGGIKNQHLIIADFENKRIGLLNASSMLRADLVRLYALEKCSFLICYTEAASIPRQILRSRAIENNIDILFVQKSHSSLFLKSGKDITEVNEIKIETKKPGFFTLYGDLIGRLSIFVSLWMLLGSIVKPFRKK